MASWQTRVACKCCAMAIIAGFCLAAVGCQSAAQACPTESTMRLNFPPHFPTRDRQQVTPSTDGRNTDSRMQRYQRRPSRWRVKLRAKYAMANVRREYELAQR